MALRALLQSARRKTIVGAVKTALSCPLESQHKWLARVTLRSGVRSAMGSNALAITGAAADSATASAAAAAYPETTGAAAAVSAARAIQAAASATVGVAAVAETVAVFLALIGADASAEAALSMPKVCHSLKVGRRQGWLATPRATGWSTTKRVARALCGRALWESYLAARPCNLARPGNSLKSESLKTLLSLVSFRVLRNTLARPPTHAVSFEHAASKDRPLLKQSRGRSESLSLATATSKLPRA
mmetsp:Transcript_65896/g.213188  ORF Transcript_65896/g.213188 Transcript_65896/m.213188 type:complete len:246 (-) Transcript_65896:352-1089(-)